MKAIVVERAGGPDAMRLAEVADPEVGAGDVLIRVAGAGVNRADVLQRMGFYPPPQGASEVLGLEVSGEVVATGADVQQWRNGDRVMALIEGGGYAELARAPATQVMTLPAGVDDVVAAGGIPEVFITGHDALFTRGRLQRGETVLIHGGAGGVGSATVQLAKRAGARVVVTAGSAEKLQRASELGADAGIDYSSEDFATRTLEITDGHGADVIIDVMGAVYLERNVSVLAADGRLVSVGLQGGVSAELDLRLLHAKRGSIIATALRARPPAQKAAIVAAFAGDALAGFADGTLRPVVHRVLPLADATEAHELLENGEVIGKLVLRAGAE